MTCDIGAYEVKAAFPFSGFLAPVDDLPIVNAAKAGSAIPVKFSLSGNRGLHIFAANSPVSQQVSCSNADPISEIEQTVTAGVSSLSYDAAKDVYSYVWKTNAAWKGTCRQLVLRLTDDTTHAATFRFK